MVSFPVKLNVALAVLKSCYRAMCIHVSCACIPVPAVLHAGISVHFNEVCLMQSSFLLYTNIFKCSYTVVTVFDIVYQL